MSGLSCEWRGRMVPASVLDADGVCLSCADPGLTEFERSYEDYGRTYYPGRDEGDDDAYDGASSLQSCPRCGASVDRLIGVTGRDGTRYVCTDCRADAMAGHRSFWHWYWKE